MMGPRLARLLADPGPVASAPLRPLIQTSPDPGPAPAPVKSPLASSAAQPAEVPTTVPLGPATPPQLSPPSASPAVAVASAVLPPVPPAASKEPPTRDARRTTPTRQASTPAAPPPPMETPAQESWVEPTLPGLAQTFETHTPDPSASASAVPPGASPASLDPAQPAHPAAEQRAVRPAREAPLPERVLLPPRASAPAPAIPPIPVAPPSQQPRGVPQPAPAPAMAVDSEPPEPHASPAEVADVAIQLTAAPSSPAGGAQAPAPGARSIAAPLQAKPATPLPALRPAAQPAALPLAPPAPPSIRITIGRVTVVAPPDPPRSARPVDAVELLMRCFQEQVSQLIGIENTAVEQNGEDSGLQPEAHTASTCSSWPRSLSSSRALRRTCWRCSRSWSTS